MKIVKWLSVLIFFALDRFTKTWALMTLAPGQIASVFPGLQWNLAFNRGIAFSGLQKITDWQYIGLVALIIGISLYIAYQLYREASWPGMFAYAAILGGALGNLWDRLTLGYIVDFIEVYVSHWYWPIFNIADSLIFIGVIGLALYWFWREQHDRLSR